MKSCLTCRFAKRYEAVAGSHMGPPEPATAECCNSGCPGAGQFLVICTIGPNFICDHHEPGTFEEDLNDIPF